MTQFIHNYFIFKSRKRILQYQRAEIKMLNLIMVWIMQNIIPSPAQWIYINQCEGRCSHGHYVLKGWLTFTKAPSVSQTIIFLSLSTTYYKRLKNLIVDRWCMHIKTTWSMRSIILMSLLLVILYVQQASLIAFMNYLDPAVYAHQYHDANPNT